LVCRFIQVGYGQGGGQGGGGGRGWGSGGGGGSGDDGDDDEDKQKGDDASTPSPWALILAPFVRIGRELSRPRPTSTAIIVDSYPTPKPLQPKTHSNQYTPFITTFKLLNRKATNLPTYLP